MNYLPSPAIRIGSARDALGVMNTVVRCVIHCPFDLFAKFVVVVSPCPPEWTQQINSLDSFHEDARPFYPI